MRPRRAEGRHPRLPRLADGVHGGRDHVGIVDRGVWITHEDLEDRYNEAASSDHCERGQADPPYCWGHGALAAGLAVGTANNEVGIVGVAYGAQFSEIVLYMDEEGDIDCGPCGLFGMRPTTDDEVTNAIRYGINANEILSMSFGGGLEYVFKYNNCVDSMNCVVEAIEGSARDGRNGLGTVVIVDNVLTLAHFDKGGLPERQRALIYLTDGSGSRRAV
ncbi:MAG: S8 family serine peptidase [Phycisphaeraceae bacterium]|nr:S8 family serine peptidase [Phycisphaeraceae bacterium]